MSVVKAHAAKHESRKSFLLSAFDHKTNAFLVKIIIVYLSDLGFSSRYKCFAQCVY